MNIFRQQWNRYRRKKRWWSIALDFLFFLLVLGLLLPGTRRPLSAFFIRYTLFSPSSNENVIYLSPEDEQFSLIDADGKPVVLGQFKGKPLFLNFWATWCPPCIAEMPSIQRLYEEMGDEVNFVLVSHESREVTQTFMKKHHYSLPFYTLRGGVPKVFDVSTIPASYLIGPNGRILISKTGAAKWDSQKVKTLINKVKR